MSGRDIAMNNPAQDRSTGENRPAGRNDMSVIFAAMEKYYSRALKRTGGFGALWAELIPDDLAEVSMIERYDRGVLTVSVRDAASRFELDRLLRSGMEQQLREKAPATLKRVRLVLAG